MNGHKSYCSLFVCLCVCVCVCVCRYDVFKNPICETFKNMEFTIFHQSCDDANCNSLMHQLNLKMKGAVPHECSDFIIVNDSCERNKGCSTLNERHVCHPIQSVVAYVSVDSVLTLVLAYEVHATN